MRYFPSLIGAAILVAGPALAVELGDPNHQSAASIAKSAGSGGGYTEIARLDARESDTPRGRAAKDQGGSDLSQIIAYYNAAIKRDPKDDDAYFHRGIAKFYGGALVPARADISQASKLDPKYPYYPLWVEIIDQRDRVASGLSAAIAQIDMTKWPAPVIHLFLGETTPAAVVAAADDVNPKTKQGQTCEANFYIGELALQQGAKQEAARLFRLAASGCPREFVEGPAAISELAVLDVSE